LDDSANGWPGASTDRAVPALVAWAVRRLVRSLASHDSFLAGHTVRVCRLAARLAARLGLGAGRRRQLGLAARLHDIGKLGVPAVILIKPGPLTPAEYARVQEHPVLGERLVAPFIASPVIRAAIRHHHERYDGRGYPDGLAGKHIPLLARILAVADSFDAITSVRSYRAAASHADGLRALEQVAGTQLDARLVQLFCEVMHRPLDSPDGPD
jgi:HD-GYP domain-containing protein (c-di-GMP phosphodiesterase class II)